MNLLDSCHVQCPYCGEPVELSIDGSVQTQSYSEDCPVCCRPMDICVQIIGGEVAVSASREDD